MAGLPRRWLGVSVLLLAGVLLAPTSGWAITRAQADQIALQRLVPEQEVGPAVVYGLPKALKAKDVVAEAFTPAILKKAGHAAWLYWEDFGPASMFVHPSRVLLVDDKTGRVTLDRALSYYPLVNGKAPAYLQSATNRYGPKYQLYSNIVEPAAEPRPPVRPSYSPPARRPAADPPGPESGDCLLMVLMTPNTGEEKANWEAAMKAWNDLAGSLKIPSYVATADGPVAASSLPKLTPPAYDANVDDPGIADVIDKLVAKEKCRDALIYIFGHGLAPEGWKNPLGKPVPSTGPTPTIQTAYEKGSPLKKLTLPKLQAAIKAQKGKATFKLVIESCFAERFDPLGEETNVKVIVGSSSPEEETKMNLNKVQWFKNVKTAVPNPGAPEFTFGMTEAGKAEIAAGKPLPELAKLVKTMFQNEKKNDRAAQGVIVTFKNGTKVTVKTTPSEHDRLVACTGRLRPFDATEVAFDFACSLGDDLLEPPGRSPLATRQATAFAIQLPGGRAVTNWLEPLGFTCQKATRVTANDTLSCTGPLLEDAPAVGNLRMSPGPSPGMGAKLYVVMDDIEQGPFDLPGP